MPFKLSYFTIYEPEVNSSNSSMVAFAAMPPRKTVRPSSGR
jgi:hypothetical protein